LADLAQPQRSGCARSVFRQLRPFLSKDVHSLAFPELVEGAYELYRRPGGPIELTVTIIGGAVTEAAWPA
jgi:hypothetical protein